MKQATAKPVSVKIRLLEDRAELSRLLNDLIDIQISAVTVHMRYLTEEREKTEARFAEFVELYEKFHQRVKIIANGGLIDYFNY